VKEFDYECDDGEEDGTYYPEKAAWAALGFNIDEYSPKQKQELIAALRKVYDIWGNGEIFDFDRLSDTEGHIAMALIVNESNAEKEYQTNMESLGAKVPRVGGDYFPEDFEQVLN